ncbi:MAG TPA: hypothetical protein VNM24_17090 [Burkholderiales bacterium]|jgi:hypothetical protein|nr:hypothetical protein [Burkholderiales bacterium]
MNRRGFLFAATLFAAPLLHAHTPYRQWKVLRQRFLLVHSTREDPAGDALAERIVAALNRSLPQANAMVARAPHATRTASLLTTGQAVLAVMRAEEALDLHAGRGRFSSFDGSSIRRLLEIEDRVLVTVDSLPRHHAWLLASALTRDAVTVKAQVPVPAEGMVPVHPGAVAFASGEPLEAQE